MASNSEMWDCNFIVLEVALVRQIQLLHLNFNFNSRLGVLLLNYKIVVPHLRIRSHFKVNVAKVQNLFYPNSGKFDDLNPGLMRVGPVLLRFSNI